MNARQRVAAVASVFLILVAVPFMLGNFYINLFSFIGIYTLVALGVVLLTGAAGLISLGQAAFVGIGAYTTAVMTTTFALSPWFGLLGALANCTVVALILGVISLRLSGHFLALITIAWGVTISLLFSNIPGLGGNSGISDIPPLSILGYSLVQQTPFYYLVLMLLALAMWGASNLLQSRQGRAFKALRGGDALVKSLGIDPFHARLKVFVAAALLSGLAGWLYAHMQRYVGPAPFELSDGIIFLLMAVVGGVGSIWGAAIGAAAIVALNTVLQDVLPLFTASSGNVEVVVYGLIFIVLLQRARSGVVGLLGAFLPAERRHVSQSNPAERFPKRRMPTVGTVLLRVSNLTRRFGGLTAVDDVSFDVHAGEILGIIGPNGAGKSTTFDMISGLRQPTSGSILFSSRDFRRSDTLAFVRAGMMRTFQHVKLRPP